MGVISHHIHAAMPREILLYNVPSKYIKMFQGGLYSS